LPIRVAAVVTLAGLVLFLLLAKASTAVVARTLTHALDSELTAAVNAVTPAVVAGRPAPQLPGPGTDVRVRVLDRAGTPVDGGGPTSLSVRDIRRLLAGQAVWTSETGSTSRAGQPTRWSGRVVSTPDGTPRLVVAAAEPVAYQALVGRTAVALAVAAVLAALAMGAAGWVAARLALRPVARLRDAATELPAGERLPLPPASDELRALAEAFNDLLGRRDAAAQRLRRFTGDAAHELRSPVAAIRAQAEVAVAHPDPALAAETLRAIADEAVRLSVLLDDLLVLARADAGERPVAVPVDLVAAAGAALARVRGDGPVVELVAPTPASVAASPSEVALVLDNLVANGRRHALSIVRVVVLPAGRWVRLVVEDDGQGIPEADRERVFDRFTRLRPEAGGGSGLGLALVSALVRGRGGTATAGATPSGGARIEVRWPTPQGASTTSPR
jgi:signal transduction histidine kinase